MLPRSHQLCVRKLPSRECRGRTNEPKPEPTSISKYFESACKEARKTNYSATSRIIRTCLADSLSPLTDEANELVAILDNHQEVSYLDFKLQTSLFTLLQCSRQESNLVYDLRESRVLVRHTPRTF